MKKPTRATRTHKVNRANNPTASKAGRRAKPKTAYDLLQRVCEVIAEEPKRYCQGWWGTVGKKQIAAESSEDLVPACGTVGCRAGWIVALHDGKREFSRSLDNYTTGDRAVEILGRGWNIDGLFHANAVRGQRGTPEYAKKGVAGIRVFMERHKAHLQARLLNDVPKLCRHGCSTSKSASSR